MLLLPILLLAALSSDHPHEQDLELRIEIVGEVPSYSWWPCRAQVFCRNKSEDTTYSLVRPNGTSRREPNASFSSEQRMPDGTWERTWRGSVGSCGIYDTNWIDEIIQVPPGEEIVLTSGSLTKFWRGNQEQEIRVSFRYEYLARPSRPEQWGPAAKSEAEAFGDMAGIEPFTLVAEPIVVRLEPPPDAPSKESIEQDLVLTLERQGTGPVFSWNRVPMTARIRNTSKTLTHRIVKLNRGHQLPSLSLQVEVIERNVSLRGSLRRNARPHFERDYDWRDEIVSLAPGEEITIDVTDLSTTMRRQDVHRALITLHYRYYAYPVQHPGHPRPVYPDDLGSMADVPSFSLRSESLELTIETPLVIELRPRTEISLKGRWKLTDVVSVYLVNRSDARLEICNSSSAAKIVIHAWGMPFDTRMSGSLVLAPNQELDLFRDHLKRDGPLYPFPRVGDGGGLEFRATFAATGWLHTLRSEDLRVKIAR